MTFAVMPQDESEWASALSTVQIPVLWHTIDALSRLRNNEQRLLARDISRVLLRDPMFPVPAALPGHSSRGLATCQPSNPFSQAIRGRSKG